MLQPFIDTEFDTHVFVFAEGTPAESFVDDEDREMFDNAAACLAPLIDTPPAHRDPAATDAGPAALAANPP
jgi:hypothetical protein